MQLNEYLDYTGETITEFAKRVGLPYVTVWRIYKRMFEPRLSHYLKIKRGSAGMVRAEDLTLN